MTWRSSPDFAEAIPEATITAETDETITPPRPVETTLDEADELRGPLRRAGPGIPPVVDALGACRCPRSATSFRMSKGRVCAQAELAWPDRKVAAVLPEGGDQRAEFEKRGWTVRDATDLADHETELQKLLGT